MFSLSAFFAPIALSLSGPAAVDDRQTNAGFTVQEADGEKSSRAALPGWMMLDAMHQVAINRQIRIERRVTIRISPSVPAQTRNLMPDLPRGALPANFVERKFGKCVAINAIAGVQPMQDNRLMLFLRDQRIISASLEKACSARDFYSGFYLDQSADGMLCVDRDKLHSRTGANCEVERMRQLVAQ